MWGACGSMLATPLYQYGQPENVQITCMVLVWLLARIIRGEGMGNMHIWDHAYIPWGISFFLFMQGQCKFFTRGLALTQ